MEDEWKEGEEIGTGYLVGEMKVKGTDERGGERLMRKGSKNKEGKVNEPRCFFRKGKEAKRRRGGKV